MTARPASPRRPRSGPGEKKPPQTSQERPNGDKVKRPVRARSVDPGASTVARIRRPKFLNEPVEVMGIKFDSKAEAARYVGLAYALQAGEIRDLEVHPRFPLVVHEQDCGAYEADFSYIVTATGERIVEDVKSPVTRKLSTYRMKAKLLWAVYGLRVREIV
jgi:hypothetical protein